MSQSVTIHTLEVRRDDWRQTRVLEESLPLPLAENEVLLRVDRQALTANNISYAAAGDSLGYWRFFPAQEGWGRIPAMGWADVVASAHHGVAEGERVWGFFPLSTHLKVTAGKVRSGSFSDVSPHREGLAPVYAQFDMAAANPLYEPAREDQDSLLRGLFLTSWLVEDFLEVNAQFGAGSCLITSASSKTSIALGHCVRQRGQLASVAITSARNADFCRSLACYDRVVTYDALAELDAARPALVVDMAGNASVLRELHQRFGDKLTYSCRIGLTHHDATGPVDDLPGVTPEFFFAPGHLQSRSHDLGSEALMRQLGAAYAGFRRACDDWLRIDTSRGPAAVEAAYQRVLAGAADPASGQIVSLCLQPPAAAGAPGHP